MVKINITNPSGWNDWREWHDEVTARKIATAFLASFDHVPHMSGIAKRQITLSVDAGKFNAVSENDYLIRVSAGNGTYAHSTLIHIDTVRNAEPYISFNPIDLKCKKILYLARFLKSDVGSKFSTAEKAKMAKVVAATRADSFGSNAKEEIDLKELNELVNEIKEAIELLDYNDIGTYFPELVVPARPEAVSESEKEMMVSATPVIEIPEDVLNDYKLKLAREFESVKSSGMTHTKTITLPYSSDEIKINEWMKEQSSINPNTGIAGRPPTFGKDKTGFYPVSDVDIPSEALDKIKRYIREGNSLNELIIEMQKANEVRTRKLEAIREESSNLNEEIEARKKELDKLKEYRKWLETDEAVW
jgi:hypothetical protein